LNSWFRNKHFYNFYNSFLNKYNFFESWIEICY
jgi:hypothetical protein